MEKLTNVDIACTTCQKFVLLINICICIYKCVNTSIVQFVKVYVFINWRCPGKVEIASDKSEGPLFAIRTHPSYVVSMVVDPLSFC